MVAQVAELGQLVADVTTLARGDAPGGQAGSAEVDLAEVDLAEVDFAEVVAAALDGARRDWPAAVFKADLEPCLVAGHAERLKTAVRNLLDNAAKFGPPGTPVEVRLHAGELTVRDHGPGIPPGDLPRVFDRFYRAASARGVPGSGLGLSIVRQVAEGHGGTVRAELFRRPAGRPPGPAAGRWCVSACRSCGPRRPGLSRRPCPDRPLAPLLPITQHACPPAIVVGRYPCPVLTSIPSGTHTPIARRIRLPRKFWATPAARILRNGRILRGNSGKGDKRDSAARRGRAGMADRR